MDLLLAFIIVVCFIILLSSIVYYIHFRKSKQEDGIIEQCEKDLNLEDQTYIEFAFKVPNNKSFEKSFELDKESFRQVFKSDDCANQCKEKFEQYSKPLVVLDPNADENNLSKNIDKLLFNDLREKSKNTHTKYIGPKYQFISKKNIEIYRREVLNDVNATTNSVVKLMSKELRNNKLSPYAFTSDKSLKKIAEEIGVSYNILRNYLNKNQATDKNRNKINDYLKKNVKSFILH